MKQSSAKSDFELCEERVLFASLIYKGGETKSIMLHQLTTHSAFPQNPPDPPNIKFQYYIATMAGFITSLPLLLSQCLWILLKNLMRLKFAVTTEILNLTCEKEMTFNQLG